jgi:(2Fe-2S) ferredoxin
VSELEKTRRKAEKKRLGTMRRHLLVCIDDDCEGKPIDKRLRKAIGKAGLRDEVSTARVRCLGICRGGPLVVVYPDGIWYSGVTEDVVDRIVIEHLVGGAPVDEHVFLRNPLAPITVPETA